MEYLRIATIIKIDVEQHLGRPCYTAVITYQDNTAHALPGCFDLEIIRKFIAEQLTSNDPTTNEMVTEHGLFGTE